MSRTFNGVATNRWINKRNFKNYLITWLGNTLGVGPALGDIYFVATADSKWEANLLECGVASSEIATSLAEGEAMLTSGQNDVLCVCPGTYTETTETDWDKNYTHMVGLGGPNIKGYDTYGTQFYTTTTSVARILDLTGHRCQFHNVTFANNGANAACLSAFVVNGYGTRLKSCQFIGMMNTTQSATAKANSLDIADYGSYLEAEDCLIGTTEWALQGADTNAPLYFSATSGTMPANGTFKNCKFHTYQAATTRALILTAGQNSVGRDWIFDRCEFYAFAVNHATVAAEVLVNTGGVPSTHDIVFKDCTAINCTAFKTDSNGCTWTTGPAYNEKGGIAVVAS